MTLPIQYSILHHSIVTKGTDLNQIPLGVCNIAGRCPQGMVSGCMTGLAPRATASAKVLSTSEKESTFSAIS